MTDSNNWAKERARKQKKTFTLSPGGEKQIEEFSIVLLLCDAFRRLTFEFIGISPEKRLKGNSFLRRTLRLEAVIAESIGFYLRHQISYDSEAYFSQLHSCAAVLRVCQPRILFSSPIQTYFNFLSHWLARRARKRRLVPKSQTITKW